MIEGVKPKKRDNHKEHKGHIEKMIRIRHVNRKERKGRKEEVGATGGRPSVGNICASRESVQRC